MSTTHPVAPSPERVAKRLMRAQRNVSSLLHRIIEGQPEWQVRAGLLEEAARLVDGDVALVDAAAVAPLLGSCGTCAGDWWAAVLPQLATSTDSSLLLDTRTVALRLPGSGVHLLARSPQDMPALDAFLLEPLVDLLALLRHTEVLAVGAEMRARKDLLTGLPNAFAPPAPRERMPSRVWGPAGRPGSRPAA